MERDNESHHDKTPDRTTRPQHTQRTPKTPSSSRLRTGSKNRITPSPPVNTDVLERIKSLEISLKQHRDVEEQLRRTLQSTRQEHTTLKEKRAGAAKAWEAKQEAKKDEKDILLAEMQGMIRDINNWKELSTRCKHDLLMKAIEKADLERQFREKDEHKANIIRDRDETEREELRTETLSERTLHKEYEDILGLVNDTSVASAALEKEFGESAVKQQKKEVKKLNREIAKLEAQVAEKKRSMKIDETNAAELELLLEKVVERRIRVLRNDQEEALHNAEEIEKKRKKQADAASQEYERLDELWTTLAQEASMQEYMLIEERDEVDKLDQTLQSLRSKIAELQR
ncbi:hypothetical protein BGZ70_009167 [Mortierella alpina]|uniref:Uncharacterized protein n=1 Tax=Mortierella alpina TaxID=64518 RepID=A0A9P6J2F1_MORAP|nr:hypothetical protein BGZ70_009167 [Mortierella alpina]